jgi:hypothetical protein
VRRWINRHGGLSRKMIYMQGHELSSFVASCDRGESYQARSDRRTMPQPVRYESANASGDRH